MKEIYSFNKYEKDSILIGVRNIGNYFANLIYPTSLYCICCESFIGENNRYSLCTSCFQKIRWNNERVCKKCGRPLRINNHTEFCNDCLMEERSFVRGSMATGYDLLERIIISKFKNGKREFIGRSVGSILADKLSEELWIEEIDFLSYVPISKEKLKIRGFNQSETICKFLGKKLEISVINTLIKKKDLSSMKRLNRLDRSRIIKGSIALDLKCKNIILNKNILIVDDVFTTGATMEECSKILLRNGAKSVSVACFSAAW